MTKKCDQGVYWMGLFELFNKAKQNYSNENKIKFLDLAGLDFPPFC